MILKIHDAHPTNSLLCIAGPVDYEYQIEQWVIDTTNDKGSEADGPPVLWEMHYGTKEKHGPVVRRWRRQPNGEVEEVPVL